MAKSILWQSLKKLIEFDQKSIQVEQALKHAHESIKKSEQILKKISNETVSAENCLVKQKKVVAFVELEAESLKQLDQQKKVRLESLDDQKAYTALKKEINKLSLAINDQEEKLIAAWSELENLENLHIKTQKKLADETVIIEKKKQEYLAIIQEKEKELQQIQEQRNEQMHKIPKEFILKYNSMRGRVEDPIVPVIQNCCGACFYAILLQDMSELKKSNLLECKNCYRFLYYHNENVDQTTTS